MSEGISYRFGYGTKDDVANYWQPKKKRRSNKKMYERRNRKGYVLPKETLPFTDKGCLCFRAYRVPIPR